MLFFNALVVCLASVVVVDLRTSTAQQTTPNPLEWAWKAYRSMFIESGKNVIMSPHSVRTALGMLLLGSCGETANTLKQLLEIESHYQTTDNFHTALRNDNNLLIGTGKVTVGNGMFANDRLRIANCYAQELNLFYGCLGHTMPFATQPENARLLINDFISQSTDGQLAEFLPMSLDPSTAVLLVSAIYFKSDWSVPFAARRTKPAKFHADTYDVIVDFMYRIPTTTLYGYTDTFEMLELPYADLVFSMYIILPSAGIPLYTLEYYHLNAAIIDASLAGMTEYWLEVSLPKFSISNKLSLQAMISNMGGSHLFGNAQGFRFGQDFQKMFDKQITPDVTVSEILHGARIDVNEQGTVASAVTAPQLEPIRVPDSHIKVNRPFLFFIRHNPSANILFWGRMEDPSRNE